MGDAVSIPIQNRSERKLTEEQVREIRALAPQRLGKRGFSHRGAPSLAELARRFCVSPRIVEGVAHYETYKWVR